MMVAHDVNPILSHLDRVIYLAGGGAVAGTPAEVITSETLTRLYGSPIEVLRPPTDGWWWSASPTRRRPTDSTSAAAHERRP